MVQSSTMRSIGALCIACILQLSLQVLAEERGEEALQEEIYVPAMKTSARFAPGSSYKEEVSVETREARRVGLLRNMWKKPRVSPLYLVNGTICRFVNSAPICTTLATTGLGLNGNRNNGTNNFNPNNLSQFGGGNQEFSLNNNNNNPTNQQQFANRNNGNNQLYTPGNLNGNNNINNQFNRQQQQQPFVSAALNEGESEEVSVQADTSSGGSSSSSEPQQQASTARPAQAATTNNRPVVATRRPLLPIRLPLRQFSIG